MDQKTQMLELLNQIETLVSIYGEYNEQEDDPDGDSPPDLSVDELKLLYNQVLEKLERPRHPIGGIS